MKKYSFNYKLKQLLTANDEVVEMIAVKYPLLDKAAKKRISRLCKKKINVNKKDYIEETDYENPYEITGVEEYTRPKWYRCVFPIAASLALIIWTGGIILNTPFEDDTVTPSTSIGFNEIENISQVEQLSDTTDNTKSDEQLSDTPKYVELGETFSMPNWVHSGLLNVTIEKAEVFNTLQDAGIEPDETFDYTIIDGLNYDAESGEFLDNYAVIMLHFKIENVNAVSEENIIDPYKYDKYDFRVDGLGGCIGGPRIYFDKAGECSGHYFAYHLEPGEQTKITAAYLINLNDVELKDVKFVTAATPSNGIIVDLNLE